jgi:hypothetical protein
MGDHPVQDPADMVRSVFGRSRKAHPEKSPMQQKVRAPRRARMLNNGVGETETPGLSRATIHGWRFDDGRAAAG